MKIILDNINDVCEFISLITRGTSINAAGLPDVVGEINNDPTKPLVEAVAEAVGEIDTADTDKPVRRRRRTKAEIEAQEGTSTVEEAVIEAIDVSVEVPAVATVPEAPEVQVQVIEAPLAHKVDLNTDHGRELALAQIAVIAEGSYKNITVIDHLNMGRNFIAAHGIQKYNEAFTLVDVPQNVMSFTQEQRTHHAAALAFLCDKLL